MAPNNSHNALSVTDILGQIAEHVDVLDRASLLRSALVSHRWQDPFLAQLWREHASFENLYCLVGKIHPIERFNRYGPLQAQISKDQLVSWKKYAPWLVKLTVPDRAMNSFIACFTTLMPLLKVAPSRYILPTLNEITFHSSHVTLTGAQEAEILELLKFIPRKLERAIFASYLSDNSLAPVFLSHAATNFPYLKSLKFTNRYAIENPQLKIHDHIAPLSRLREIIIPIYFVSRELLYQLVVLPSLEILEFTTLEDYVLEDDLLFMEYFEAAATRVRTDKILPFLHLKTLTGAVIPANNPHDCFRLLAAAVNIVRLSLLISLPNKVEGLDCEIDQESLYGAISSLKGLEFLNLEFCHHFNLIEPPQTAPLKALPSTHLTNLVHLKELYITHPSAFGFGGNHIVLASAHWPRLKILELRDFYSKDDDVFSNIWESPSRNKHAKPECHPQIFRELLANLPDLERLAINFTPWDDASIEWDSTFIPCSLKEIVLGQISAFNKHGERDRLIEYLSTVSPLTMLIFDKYHLEDLAFSDSDEPPR
jgi:hypothetical protein